MAFSDDNIIQNNEGFVVASGTVTASLPSGTTAGNSVVVFIGTGLSGITGLPSGFEAVGSTGSSGIPICFHKPNVGAGETSWNFTGSAADHAWIAMEVFNLETVSPADVVTLSSSTSRTNGQTLTAPAAQSASLSTMNIAVFEAALISGTATKSWGSYTDNMVEIAQVEATSGTQRHALAVARNFNDGNTGTFSCTGTLTISTGSATCRARMYIFREKGSPVGSPLTSFFTGWEFGTHGGLGSGVTLSGLISTSQMILGSGTALVGTWGTNYSVQSGSARNGGYGLSYSVSGATCNLPVSGASAGVGVIGRNIRVVSGSGIATVMTIDSTTDLLLVYDFSTNQYGLRWGAGTVAYQAGTTALNTWVWVSVQYNVNSTTHTAAWTLETGTDTYTAQTAPADLTGQSAVTTTSYFIGGLSSQTLTMDVDEVGQSSFYGAHPLTPFKVVLLKVDPAGTPTVSGTTANFNVFTANGTLAAWNATNARNAVDEVPPTVSASADGVAQVTLAASDYMEFPMETYTLASDEVVAAVRAVVPLWGGTGSGAGTLSIRGWDGTTETELVSNTPTYDAGSPTALSLTDPYWMAINWTNAWNQTKLNNACVRVGFSTDATPDMGVHAVYLEVAIRKSPKVRTVTVEDPISASVDLYVNPDNSATVSYLITNNDASRSVNFNYSLAGTPQTPVTVSPSSNQTVDVHADAFGDVSDLSLEVI